jgi:hypothetical protein
VIAPSVAAAMARRPEPAILHGGKLLKIVINGRTCGWGWSVSTLSSNEMYSAQQTVLHFGNKEF